MTKAERCARMREAKARRRMALGSAPDVRELGRAVFSGVLFGGEHTVRLLGIAGRTALDVEVDGRVTCCKTQRGARALLMRRLAHPRIGCK
jgi:ribosomal protein S8E